jgi:HlyD family secretion protein
VASGAPLFALETNPEKAAKEEAERRLTQARASLEDARKGKRPTELDAIEAQIRQAQAALELSESELARQTRLIRTGATSQQDLDRAKATRDQDCQRIVQLEADLATARLGSREAQIAAAEANVRALEAALARADWDYSQKRQTAPQAALVFDAGKPVVSLLPPSNIKVRAFIPEEKIGTIRLGETVQVRVDGEKEPFTGRVSFISPQAEYTPPVIYSRESRSKLVFMIEAVFEPKIAARLHPGQPVDVAY